jgi:hypothetical protein
LVRHTRRRIGDRDVLAVEPVDSGPSGNASGTLTVVAVPVPNLPVVR